MLSELETPVVFTETPVSLGVAMVTWGDVITDVSGRIVYIIWVRAYGNEYSSLTNASFVSAVSNHLLYSKARFFGSLALREGRCIYSMSNNPTPTVSGVNPVNTKHLYNICTLSDQRRRRWAGVVQMLYKSLVFAGKTANMVLGNGSVKLL